MRKRPSTPFGRRPPAGSWPLWTAPCENPNLAAILMTGFVEQDAVQMQQEGLIDEIFLKPLDYRKLTEKIGKLLAGEPDLTTV